MIQWYVTCGCRRHTLHKAASRTRGPDCTGSSFLQAASLPFRTTPARRRSRMGRHAQFLQAVQKLRLGAITYQGASFGQAEVGPRQAPLWHPSAPQAPAEVAVPEQRLGVRMRKLRACMRN
eukprot:1494122-Rhodomonas_salina.2